MAAATARVAAGKATAAGSASSVLPWISVAGIVVVIIAGAVVGTQAWRKSARPSPAPAPAAIRLGPESGAGTERPGPDSTADATEAATSRNQALARPVPSRRRAGAPASPPDLRDQTSLIDGARNGLASGAAEKALTLVRQYQQRYPGGIFDPEAAALRIEALVRLGRSSEARGLAERFVATQPAGPLTERVKAVAGLARP